MKIPENIEMSVVAPDNKALNANIKSLTIETVNGSIGIMPGHINFFSAFDQSELTYTDMNNEIKNVVVFDGVIEVNQGSIVTISCLEYYEAKDIDLIVEEKKKAQLEYELQNMKKDQDYTKVRTELLKTIKKIQGAQKQ